VNLKTVLPRGRAQLGVVVAAAGLAAVALTGCSSSGSAHAAQQSSSPSVTTASVSPPGVKPTVVLVHGAFTDASEWDGVIKQLEAAGYPVVAPPNPLRDLASDTAYLRSFLKTIKGPVILAGHSIGGMVTTQAAVGDPQVKALVYIAALIPDVGETPTQLVGKYPGATLGNALMPVPVPGGMDLYVQPSKLHDVYAADVPTSITDVMAAAQRPVAGALFGEKATEVAWKTIPSWDLITTQDQAATLKVQEFMAARAHAHTMTVDASHAVAVSHPDKVASIIEQAAAATVH
jgi:pimeloyl-ACP methyl ester carboxylesterase